MKKSKLTPEEIEEILSKPFEIFPEPGENAKAKGITKRQPLGWQKLAFNWEHDWEKRLANENTLHCHNLDCLLVYSGGGTGKSNLGISLNLFFMTAFPGCQTLIMANLYNDVERIVIPKLMELLSFKSPWDHPYISHIPNKQDKYLDLTIPTLDENGKVVQKTSRCWLGHASDWERLRGPEYVFIDAEEISHFKEPRIIDECGRRLRSSLAPFRMLYATTNPPESMSHFMYDRWDLTEFIPEYDGEKPADKLCTCQFCPECYESQGEFLFDSEGLCSNPNCSFLSFCKKQGLIPTRFKKPTWTYKGKIYSCPGNQKFWRVLHPDPLENIHNPANLIQELKAGHDEANFAVYAKGEVRALRSNKVFPSYSYEDNTNANEIAVDPNKDIVWSHDFNKRPRCSVVVQEYIKDKENFLIQVIDEIVLYDTKKQSKVPFKFRIKGVGPEHMAEEFINRYSNWNAAGIANGKQRIVFMHGDHTSLNNKMSPFSPNEFQIMHDMLVKAGFKVIVCVVKIPGKMQVGQADRITLTNWLLKDDKNNSRIKINKKCRNLLKSLEDLERKSTDKEEIDKDCDELARKATNTNIAHLISHPADALGYYLIRCFNLVKEDDLIKFIYIEGGNLLNIDSATGKITNVPKLPDPDEDRRLTIAEIEEENKKTYLERIREAVNQSIVEDEMDDVQNFLSYFG